MKIAVCSSTQFGYRCIRDGLLGLKDVELVGILTTPREINISYSEKPVRLYTHAKFKKLAKRADCELVKLSGKITIDKYLIPIEKWKPDLILILGWYYIIPRKIRESIPLGCIGIHASLLPRYRGGAPINWAIINGEKETGITLFYIESGVDTGDIVAQEKYPIKDSDTCATIYNKATNASIEILKKYIPLIAINKAPRIKQDENEAFYVSQRNPEDGLIDWHWGAKRIKNFIRAQTKPYAGAFTYIQGKKVIIWDADIEEQNK